MPEHTKGCYQKGIGGLLRWSCIVVSRSKEDLFALQHFSLASTHVRRPSCCNHVPSRSCSTDHMQPLLFEALHNGWCTDVELHPLPALAAAFEVGPEPHAAIRAAAKSVQVALVVPHRRVQCAGHHPHDLHTLQVPVAATNMQQGRNSVTPEAGVGSGA